jgi:hypothetical protein
MSSKIKLYHEKQAAKSKTCQVHAMNAWFGRHVVDCSDVLQRIENHKDKKELYSEASGFSFDALLLYLEGSYTFESIGYIDQKATTDIRKQIMDLVQGRRHRRFLVMGTSIKHAVTLKWNGNTLWLLDSLQDGPRALAQKLGGNKIKFLAPKSEWQPAIGTYYIGTKAKNKPSSKEDTTIDLSV